MPSSNGAHRNHAPRLGRVTRLHAGSTVHLPYGRAGLDVRLPIESDLVESESPRQVPDERTALVEGMRRPIASLPLATIARRGASVGISVCDVTRPFPASRVLPILLDELNAAAAGVITIYIATGTHRPCTPEELERMLGPGVIQQCAIVQHDAFDAGRHRRIGTVIGSETPALIEARFLDEDIRITTGFIEPHFFAGFSGGPKMVAPGLAAIETTIELHSADRIGHPQARWGVTVGNPIHDAIRAIASDVRVDFNLDLTLNSAGLITGVFAGELFESHAAGCLHAQRSTTVQVQRPYDIVVTTNSGYPLDQNLYQSVKGMSAAAQIVRSGGTILIATECSDGMPAHGRYRALLADALSPDAFLSALSAAAKPEHDQWQVQVQAQVQRKARVLVFSSGLPQADIHSAWLEPVGDIGATLRELTRDGDSAVAILPQGPQTIPVVFPDSPVDGN